MITEAILNVLINGLGALVKAIPLPGIGVDVGAAIAEAASWIYWGNYYLPLDIFGGLIVGYFAVWIGCAVTSAILQLL